MSDVDPFEGIEEQHPRPGTLLDEPDVGGAGAHGAQGDPATPPSSGHETRPGSSSAEADASHEPTRSAVKITKTTRGTTFEVRVLAGDPEEMVSATREIAVRQYRSLERELP